MASKLESALVIALQDTIKWESSSGTAFPSVSGSDKFDPIAYQTRDRYLAYRDLMLSAAVVKASIHVSDVFNYSTIKPNLQGYIPDTSIVYSGTPGVAVTSQMRHVDYSSIPYDAAQYADSDLYSRDAVVYETLVAACKAAFSESTPITDDDIANKSDIQLTGAWPLGEGASARDDINETKPLDKFLFKNPDSNLAQRDNQNAGYVAKLAQILLNPFEHAHRIYVQVVSSVSSVTNVVREPDIYALVSDDGTSRTYQAEPAMAGTNCIIYNKSKKTLQWIRENTNDLHVPQIYALEIPGIESGETIQTLPEIPSVQDAQYWRTKASQVVPGGTIRSDIAHLGPFDFSGGTQEALCHTLTSTSSASCKIPAISVGNYELSLLVNPSPNITLLGQANSSTLTKYHSASDGSVTLDLNVPLDWNLQLPTGQWMLQCVYSDASGQGSAFGLLAQYVQNGSAAVDIGSDTVAIVSPTGSSNTALSASNIFEVKDTLLFALRLKWTYSTISSGSFCLHSILLTKVDSSSLSYSITGIYNGNESNSTARFSSVSNQYSVIKFPFSATSNHSAPTPFSLSANESPFLPVKILGASIQSTTTTNPLPLATALPGWRQKCLERAERVIQQGYSALLTACQTYGYDYPSYLTSTSALWTDDNTDEWLRYIETHNPRLRQGTNQDGSETFTTTVNGSSVTKSWTLVIGRQYLAVTDVVYDSTTYKAGSLFYGHGDATTDQSYTGTVCQTGALIKAKPGHIGQPCLVPFGVYFDASAGSLTVDRSFQCMPVFMTCQPWMIEHGMYVVQPEFWMPSIL
jgi:hypothetical protein